MPSRRMLSPCVLVFALFVASCGGDDPTGPPPAGEVDESGGAVGEVDESGGAVTFQSGAVRLTFPPGAVSQGITITVEQSTGHPAREGLLENRAFEFGPDGTQFAQPVELTISFSPGDISGGAPEGSLALHKVVGSGWVKVTGSTVDRTGNRVSGQITSFSVYAIISLGAPDEVVTGGGTQQAIAGEAVGVAPSVVVRNSSGQALAGLTVDFQVTSGGGSVTGAAQVTDAQGRAAVGSWTLGTTAGPNELRANVEGLGSPVVFDATGIAGPAAVINKVAGDAQSAVRGGAVEVSPSVIVDDANGNHVEGTQVVFAAGQNGSVSQQTVTTAADGSATLTTWTLGDVGENLLTVSAGQAPPATFMATATDPCLTFPGISLGETVTGTVTDLSCVLENRLVDYYMLTLTQQTQLLFTLDAPDFTAWITARDQAGTGDPVVVSGSSVIGSRFAILTAGTYRIRATSMEDEARTGSYTYRVEEVPGDLVGCHNANLPDVNTGVVINGLWATGDCTDPIDVSGSFYHDSYLLLAQPGRTYTVAVTTTAQGQAGPALVTMAAWIGDEIIALDDRKPGTALITFSVNAAAFIALFPIIKEDGMGGPYTFSVSATGSAAGQVAAPTIQIVRERGEPVGRSGGRQ